LEGYVPRYLSLSRRVARRRSTGEMRDKRTARKEPKVPRMSVEICSGRCDHARPFPVSSWEFEPHALSRPRGSLSLTVIPRASPGVGINRHSTTRLYRASAATYVDARSCRDRAQLTPANVEPLKSSNSLAQVQPGRHSSRQDTWSGSTCRQNERPSLAANGPVAQGPCPLYSPRRARAELLSAFSSFWSAGGGPLFLP
jgi:hypothetical protein